MQSPDDDELGFNDLTDDQIVELAVALAREAMSRNPALLAAFSKALLDEKERVEAAAKGSDKVRRDEAQRIERQAQAAAEALARERERRRVQSALSAYLRRGAAIIGQATENLTLIWDRDPLQTRGTAPKLRINPRRQRWSLVEYDVTAADLHTSPGLRGKQAELLPWCREVSAAMQSLGIERTTEVLGEEACAKN